MCSIGGWIASNPLPPDIAARLTNALMFYGQTRGSQSTGLYINNTLIKRAIEPSQFIYLPEVISLLETPAAIALTHTRAPTSGGRDDEHAQPFMLDNTITVHNGSYHNCPELRIQFSLDKSTNVDSELVTSYIHQYGPEALTTFLTAAHGVSAIATIYNNILYLVRDNNPIEYQTIILADEAHTKLLVFASTETILLQAIRSCWLISPSTHTITVPNGRVHSVTHEGIYPIGEQMQQFTYTTHNYNIDDDRQIQRWIDWSGNRHIKSASDIANARALALARASATPKSTQPLSKRAMKRLKRRQNALGEDFH